MHLFPPNDNAAHASLKRLGFLVVPEALIGIVRSVRGVVERPRSHSQCKSETSERSMPDSAPCSLRRPRRLEVGLFPVYPTELEV